MTQWRTKDNDDGGGGIGVMRSWPTTMAAGGPSNLQRPLAHVPRGSGASEEGGAKTTIGGGEEEWAQKWGCNNNDNEYGANKVASAARTIRQSTIRG